MNTNNHPAEWQEQEQEQEERIILLLDLDCFYAQCESVRLGLDPSLPLALLQWDSALAVNYPARQFGIKRGDSFQDISNKSNAQCVCIHLPILPIVPSTNNTTTTTSTNSNNENDINMEDAYEKEFCTPPHLQKEAFLREMNILRHQSEGKASLERYRLASARIFKAISQALTDNVGRGNFILERASIDEMYVDLTTHCHSMDTIPWSSMTNDEDDDDLKVRTKKETVIVCNTDVPTTTASTQALWRGSIIARGIRKHVHDTLGFTLSAGISINKLVAKLGATFGKPDGQAVIFPEFIPNVMDITQIKTARFLGGKLGKRVCALLPTTTTTTTLGSVSRLLSLHDLCKGLGSKEAGQLAFNICHGVDSEPVRETYGALIKSITASKNVTGTLKDIHKWIALLAGDVLTRVDIDTKRNHRIPKRCTVHCLATTTTATTTADTTSGVTEWKQQSIRIDFPKEFDHHVRLNKLIANVCAALEKKGFLLFRHIGLAATDFEVRVRNGIDTFFCTNSSSSSSSSRTTLIISSAQNSNYPEGEAEETNNDDRMMLSDDIIVNNTIMTTTSTLSPSSTSATKKFANVCSSTQKQDSVDKVKNPYISQSARKRPKPDILTLLSKASCQNNKIDALDSNKSDASTSKYMSSSATTATTTTIDTKLLNLSTPTAKEIELVRLVADEVLEDSSNTNEIASLDPDHEYAKKLQNSYDKEHVILASLQHKDPRSTTTTRNKIETFFVPQKKVKLSEPQDDLGYAKKLQAAYDRENSLLSSIKYGGKQQKRGESSKTD